MTAPAGTIGTVSTRERATFDELTLQAGALAGTWEPWTFRGAVTFASIRQAREAAERCGEATL